MYPKCVRCGTRFDPAFSPSRRLCGDCHEIVEGRYQARIAGNLTPDAADVICTCGHLWSSHVESGCQWWNCDCTKPITPLI